MPLFKKVFHAISFLLRQLFQDERLSLFAPVQLDILPILLAPDIFIQEGQRKKAIAYVAKIKLLQKVEEKTRLAEVKASWQERKSTGELPSCHPPSKPDNPRQNHNLDISVHASHGLCGVVDSLVLTRLVVVWCQGGFRGWHVRFKQ